MAYASWSVVFGEQPSAAKWNILGTNDAAFNNGTGLPSASSNTAYVATGETTTSVTYTGLTTPLTLTMTIGSTGIVLVSIHSQTSNSGANLNYVSFAMSGTNTLASADKYSAGAAGNPTQACSGVWILKSLNTGSTTFTEQYRVNAGTGTFTNRHISVVTF